MSRKAAAPPTGGFVTLGQIADRPPMVEISCNRCDPLGRVRIARLLATHGAELPVPELRHVLAADCPRMMAGHLHDVCGVHFQGLRG